jgi:hypothetical protein
MDIPTCDDFRHLNVECCDTCHNFHPHYETKQIDLRSGGWVCHAESSRISARLIHARRNTQEAYSPTPCAANEEKELNSATVVG